MIARYLVTLLAVALVASVALAQSQPAPTEKQTERASEHQKTFGYSAPATHVIIHGELNVKSAKTDGESTNKQTSALDIFLQWLTRFLDFKLTDTLITIFTGLLAWFTIRLARSTSTAAAAALIQARVAEDAFTKLERPYVYIFGVSKFDKDRSDSVSDPPHVKYVVANYGRTPATIEIVEFGISTFPDEPLDTLVLDYRDDAAHELLKNPILAPQDVRRDLRVHAPGNIAFKMPEDSKEILPALNDNEQLFVWLKIKYRGPFVKGLETSACWRFDMHTNRLVQWGDEEKYNYVK